MLVKTMKAQEHWREAMRHLQRKPEYHLVDPPGGTNNLLEKATTELVDLRFLFHVVKLVAK